MNLLNVADMLADVLKIENIYAGNIDQNAICCVGIYNSKNSTPQRICVGGKACTKTHEKHISILIHWTDNPTKAEEKALSILDIISEIRQYQSDEYVIKYLECNEPISVGRDDRGICEYVIESTIYYERNEKNYGNKNRRLSGI